MKHWTQKERTYLSLGDPRRNQRFCSIVESLAEHPTASVPRAMPSWYDIKATYAFWRNQKVDESSLMEAIAKASRDRCSGHSMILVVHDTTNVSFASDAEGLGYLDHGLGKGLMMHSSLALTSTSEPVGLLHQMIWARDWGQMGKKKTRAQRPIEEKESYRWLKGINASNELLKDTPTVIHLADREADIYELFAMKRSSNSHLLIRATHNRALSNGALLWNAVATTPVRAEKKLQVPRADGKKERTAHLSIRYASVEMVAPKNNQSKSHPALRLQAILVTEEDPPAGTEPLQWQLLTTLPIHTKADALQYIEWYGFRWKIERFHYVLKSGCRVEELQLQTAVQLKKALITFSLVAWKIMWLVYESRKNPDTPCDTVLEQHEWRALYQHRKKTFEPPEQPPTLTQAVRWIAMLGGFLGRANDGYPGVKTTWLGLRRLNDLADMWMAFEKGSYQQNLNFG